MTVTKQVGNAWMSLVGEPRLPSGVVLAVGGGMTLEAWRAVPDLIREFFAEKPERSFAPHDQRGCLVAEIFVPFIGFELIYHACVTCDEWLPTNHDPLVYRPSGNRGAVAPGWTVVDADDWGGPFVNPPAPEDKHVQAIKDNLMGGKR